MRYPVRYVAGPEIAAIFQLTIVKAVFLKHFRAGRLLCRAALR
jgi:hypothetical protein